MAVTGDTGTYFDVGTYQLDVSLPQSSAPGSPAPSPAPVNSNSFSLSSAFTGGHSTAD